MGRLFLIRLQGPVYKCKACQTDLGLANDIVNRSNLFGSDGKLYAFSRLFNVFLVASQFPRRREIYCVKCSAFLGAYCVSAVIESDYRLWRRELHGPEGSDDEV